MEKEFQASYKKLNAAQKLAVDAIDGPVLVVAGPGTGKTQLLSLRVANILLKTDTDPANILCLTFTNKAATNMRERLYQLVGPTSRNVVVRTFHGFAADIMNEYPDNFWEGARLSVAPDAIQTEIIQEILSALPLSNPLASTFAGAFTALGDVKQALRLIKEAGLTPDELRAAINSNLEYIDRIEPKLVDLVSPTLSSKKLNDLLTKINKLPSQNSTLDSLILDLDKVIYESLAIAVNNDALTKKTTNTGRWKQRWVQTVSGQKGMHNERKRNEWWLEVSAVYEKYRHDLHRRGYYDYSDMMIEVLEQIQAQPDMKADLQERFPYVLIDEFQDTNAAQLRLAHLVSDHYSANNRPNLMAVGDDDQSIFAFNGAELNNMLGFQRSYPDTKLIVLTENYRSSQAVLDISGQIIEQAEDRLVKREASINKNLIAKKPPAKPSVLKQVSYPTRQHQQIGLAKQIKKLWDEGETDIAVLARKHDSLEQLASILLSQDVPISYERKSNTLDQEAVKQACLIAELAVNVAEGDISKVNVGIAQLIRHPMWQISPKTLWKLATANYSKTDWLDSLLSHQDSELNKIGHWLVWLARISNSQPLPLVMEYILGLREGEYMVSPFRDYYLSLKQLSSEYMEAVSAISNLLGLTQEFADQKATLQDFVRFIELNRTTGSTIADESWFVSGEKAVKLLTVYKAKGLEFDHVFVVDAIESMWRPRSGGRTSPANLMLQAYGEKYDDYIRLLYVSVTRARQNFIATGYMADDKGAEILATPLLGMLPTEVIESPAENPIEVIESDIRWPRLDTNNEKILLSERLSNLSLSQSALIDFLNVAEAGPASFIERHLLHIPKARSESGSYGTAIHAALETAQRLVNTSKLDLGTILDRFEAALADEHLSPLDFERFKNRGEVLLNKLFAEPQLEFFKGGLAEQRISDVILSDAKINGKIDRIDIIDRSLIISDYKTGGSLTSFETKNQTKQIKAWRHRNQLLFYSLLVTKCGRFKNVDSVHAQMLYLESEKLSDQKLGFEPDTEALARLESLIESVWQRVLNLDFPSVDAYSKDINGILQFESDLLAGKI
jgi:DNA helicase II / ATP-dependent DNA helicase PcrA